MTHNASSLDVDLLLRQTDWLHRLATGLLKDPSRADDAVQDTLLTALERPPRDTTSPMRVRAWLGRVLRSRVRDSMRSEGRRSERQQAVARGEATPSVGESIERVGVQRDLVQAVLTLEPGYREVVVLRYFEELGVAQTAQRLGISPGAVRTRTSRGLEMLRARLDAEYGQNRSAWALALQPFVRPQAAAGVAGAVAGVVFSKALWGTIAAAVVLVGAWAVIERGAGAPPGPPQLTSGTEVAVAPLPGQEHGNSKTDAVAAPEGDHERVEAVLEQPDAPVEPAGPIAVVTARVVDEGGRPIEGVELATLLFSLKHDEGPTALSDANGDVRLEIPWHLIEDNFPQTCSFMARGHGWASTGKNTHFNEPSTQFLGTITMVPGGDVRGRVVDRQGTGVAGARVSPVEAVNEWNGGPDSSLRVTGGKVLAMWGDTGADGSFLLEGLPATTLTISARATGTFHSFSEPVLVGVGVVSDAGVLVLDDAPAEQRIAGRVLAADGSPAVAERVRLQPNEHYVGISTFTDESGGFDFTCLPNTTYLVVAGRPGHDHKQVEVASGTLDLVIQYREAGTFVARVVATDGGVLEQIRGSIMTPESRGIAGGNAEAEHSDSIELPLSDDPFLASVWAFGYRAKTLGPFDPKAMPEEVVFELEPAFGICGRLLANGKPLAGARADWHSGLEGNPALARTKTGFFSYVDPRPRSFSVAPADGSFFLEIHRDAARVHESELIYIHGFAEGFARTEVGPISLASLPLADELELELTPGGSVRGRVLGPPGFDARGQTVVLSRADGHLPTFEIEEGDSFRFEHVTRAATSCDSPTRTSSARPETGYMFEPYQGAAPWNVTVREGEETVFDLNAGDAALEYRITGRFLMNGEPAAGWSWSFGSWGTNRFGSKGEFVGNSKKRESRLTIRSPFGSHKTAGFFQVLEFDGPEMTWERDITTGRVELSGVDLPMPPSNEELGDWYPEHSYRLVWQSEDGLVWVGDAWASKDDRAVFPQVPAGSVRLLRSTIAGAPLSDEGLILEFDLAPGELREIVIPK